MQISCDDNDQIIQNCIFCCILGKFYNDMHEEESSVDVSSPRENNSPIVSAILK